MACTQRPVTTVAPAPAPGAASGRPAAIAELSAPANGDPEMAMARRRRSGSTASSGNAFTSDARAEGRSCTCACNSTTAESCGKRRRGQIRAASRRALLVLPLLPLHVGAAGMPVQHARQHEHQVGQAVQVLARAVVDLVLLAERDQRALGAAAGGAADVGERRRARAAGQDELGEPRQVGVVVREPRVEARDLLRRRSSCSPGSRVRRRGRRDRAGCRTGPRAPPPAGLRSRAGRRTNSARRRRRARRSAGGPCRRACRRRGRWCPHLRCAWRSARVCCP